ncbi:MAG: GNAT family protein [Candidatus Eisenbacteria bacterium]
MIPTARLTLVPATVAHARAELADRAEFARLLNATVPADWPPASTVDALPLFLGWLEAAPAQSGWFGWYALARVRDGEPPVLVGGGGFLGPPAHGGVQLGYSMLPAFQGKGYATELVGGLVRWAFAQPGVGCIVAETEWANPASVRVLEKSGFVRIGAPGERGGARFERREPAAGHRLEPAALQRRLERMFAVADHAEATRLMEHECGPDLPLMPADREEGLVRVRCAVLKLSGGSLDELRTAIRIAREDWRDSLVAAGFGHGVRAHRDWLDEEPPGSA